MSDRRLNGDWSQLKAALRAWWPRLTEFDVTPLAGEREELMRLIKNRYEMTYGQIECEVTEFELRDVRSAHTSRPSPGISNDW